MVFRLISPSCSYSMGIRFEGDFFLGYVLAVLDEFVNFLGLFTNIL